MSEAAADGQQPRCQATSEPQQAAAAVDVDACRARNPAGERACCRSCLRAGWRKVWGLVTCLSQLAWCACASWCRCVCVAAVGVCARVCCCPCPAGDPQARTAAWSRAGRPASALPAFLRFHGAVACTAALCRHTGVSTAACERLRPLRGRGRASHCAAAPRAARTPQLTPCAAGTGLLACARACRVPCCRSLPAFNVVTRVERWPLLRCCFKACAPAIRAVTPAFQL
jgi:hypothetical protein